MWHVSSRSGVETLRTAIHLLLTCCPLASSHTKPSFKLLFKYECTMELSLFGLVTIVVALVTDFQTDY